MALYTVSGALEELKVPRHVYEYHLRQGWLPVEPTHQIGRRMFYSGSEVGKLRKHFDRWRRSKIEQVTRIAAFLSGTETPENQENNKQE